MVAVSATLLPSLIVLLAGVSVIPNVTLTFAVPGLLRVLGGVAVIVTGPPTEAPLTLKIALVCPAKMVTVGGTVAIAGLDELSAILVSDAWGD